MTEKQVNMKNSKLKQAIKNTVPSENKVNLGSDGLPGAKSISVIDPSSLKGAIIAPPGWGKTTLATAPEDSLLLAFEEGHKFVNCHKIVIDSWAGGEDYIDSDGDLHLDFREARRRILASDRFKLIVIDTFDEMIWQCEEYHCKKGKVSDISDLGDYGKGFKIGRNTPVRQAMNELIKSGRGVISLTHQKIQEITKGKGDNKIVIQKKVASVTDTMMTILHKQCDFIFHGEFGKIRKGNKHRDRIVHCDGTDDLLAKNRGGKWPKSFILPENVDDVWQKLRGFLENPETVEEAYQEYLEFYQR